MTFRDVFHQDFLCDKFVMTVLPQTFEKKDGYYIFVSFLKTFFIYFFLNVVEFSGKTPLEIV